jgi:hypothetical protein
VVDPAHTDVPPSGLHFTPHAPQFDVVFKSTHCPLHSVVPPVQTNEHVPEEHAAVALGTWVVQACPHDPQLFTSDEGSTQLPLHGVDALDGHAVTHA